MARGARSAKSRYGSSLEPLSHIEAVLYVKPSRDLHSLSETSHVQTFPAIRSSLHRTEAGLRCLELVNAVQEVGHVNKDLFALLVTVLSALDHSEERFENLFPYFQLRLADLLGFSPPFKKKSVEALPDEGGFLFLQTGEIDTSPTDGPFRKASRSSLRAFAVLSRASIRHVLRMNLQSDIRSEATMMVTDYLKHHLEEAYPKRTARVYSQIQR